MLNSEIALNSSLFPAGFRREFDAHIYFTAETRSSASLLRSEALAFFKDIPVFVGSLIDRKIGPHPLPMFEINFSSDLCEKVTNWLRCRRGDHTVLIHEVTGDDPKDHSSGAVWLGTPLELDLTKLEPGPKQCDK
jgi:DOPA 4,5-dioxygenase